MLFCIAQSRKFKSHGTQVDIKVHSNADHNLELLQVELAIAVLIGLSVNGLFKWRRRIFKNQAKFFGGKSVFMSIMYFWGLS